MTPGELTGMIASFAALVAAGGWIANLGLQQVQRRKLDAEAEKAELDLSNIKDLNAKTLFSTAGDLIENLRREVARLSDRLKDIEAKNEEFRTAEIECQKNLDRANLRISRLEAATETGK